MTNSVNKGLYLPDKADTGVDVAPSLKNNFIIIDTELKKNEDALATHKTDTNAHDARTIAYTDGSVRDALDRFDVRLTENAFLSVNKINVYDPSKAADGYIDSSTGTVVTSTGARVSDFIAVNPGEVWTGNFNWNSGYYDVNFAFVSAITSFGIPSTTITIPVGIRYVRLAFANPDTTAIAQFVKGTNLPAYLAYDDVLNSKVGFITDQAAVDTLVQMLNTVGAPYVPAKKWQGKKVNFLGTSITNGYLATTSFQNYVKDDLTLSVIRNYGINSSTVALKDVSNPTNAMATRYTNMDNDADLVVVECGPNDALNNITIGTITDGTVTTYYGALNVLFAGLVAKYPTKKLLVLTPIQATNVTKAKLKTYVDAVKASAEQFSIPVLDLFGAGQIDPYTTAQKTAFYVDELHPNNAGHRRMADRISAAIATL